MWDDSEHDGSARYKKPFKMEERTGEKSKRTNLRETEDTRNFLHNDLYKLR